MEPSLDVIIIHVVNTQKNTKKVAYCIPNASPFLVSVNPFIEQICSNKRGFIMEKIPFVKFL